MPNTINTRAINQGTGRGMGRGMGQGMRQGMGRGRGSGMGFGSGRSGQGGCRGFGRFCQYTEVNDRSSLPANNGLNWIRSAIDNLQRQIDNLRSSLKK